MFRVLFILVLITGFTSQHLQAKEDQTPLRLIATHVPPYFNYAADGSVSGIGADILKAAGKECGTQIELSNHTWARALRHAEMGHADAIAPLAKTNGRDKNLHILRTTNFHIGYGCFHANGKQKTYQR